MRTPLLQQVQTHTAVYTPLLTLLHSGHVRLTGKFQCLWGREVEQSEVESATAHPHSHWSDEPYLLEVFPSPLPLLMPKLQDTKGYSGDPFHTISRSVSHTLLESVYSCGSFAQEGKKKKKLSLYAFFTQSVLYESQLCACSAQTANISLLLWKARWQIFTSRLRIGFIILHRIKSTWTKLKHG